MSTTTATTTVTLLYGPERVDAQSTAIATCSEHGEPTKFLCLSCNPVRDVVCLRRWGFKINCF